jgi:hypothetical protein
MSTPPASAPAAPPAGVTRPRSRRQPPRPPAAEPSRQARQRAAVVLEVLAGARTPAGAACALGVSLPRYYLLEQQAVAGLVSACEPPPRGRAAAAGGRLEALERDCRRWQKECARQQALLHAAQRGLGLAAPAAPAAKAAGRKRRPRRPAVRALRAVARLREPEEAAGGTSTAEPLRG